MKKTYACLCLLFCWVFCFSQNTMTGAELLEKSIRYHDPDGRWQKARLNLSFTETRPGAADRTSQVFLDNKKETFRLEQLRDGHRLVREIKGSKCQHLLDGSSQISAEDTEKHRLTCERTQTIRNYYSYLWGLPMKLKDPGTKLHKTAPDGKFLGQPCQVLKVTYDESVGTDTWFFYFHPETFAMIGYRFYHDPKMNDGEYITLEGEELIDGIRFPKKRSWYVNADDEFLGTDVLEKK